MARVSERDVRLGRPEHGKGSPARSVSGRRCSYPGCSTVLSIYNPSSTCWLHSDRSCRHALYGGR
jgi:hypothetical protein